MKKKGKRKNCISKVDASSKSKFFKCSAFFKKLEFHKLIIIVIALGIGLSSGVYIYAKYYSVKAKEGIAIATGIYFTANYAVSTTDDGEFVESLVNSSYSGTSTSFTFEIRNYENNLLFNTNNVNIPYEVKFWLEEEISDGTVYMVGVGDNLSETLNKGEAVYDGIITGGSAKSNIYTISVNVPEEKKHTPVPIYVQVQTKEGSLINRILKGKMLLSSLDIAKSYIEFNQFTVPDDIEQTDEAAKYEALKEVSILTYEIRTAGAVLSGELTEKLTLSWNTNVLQIDLFDEAYTSWLEEQQKINSNINGPTVDANGWCSIEIEAMPYASENIGFFRGDEFATKATDWKTLHTFIKVEQSTTSS